MVEAFVLDLLEGQVFNSRDFAELPSGICRIRAPLTHNLALTLPKWRMLMAPIIGNLAQTFRTALTQPHKFQAATLRQNHARRARKAAQPSPLSATPRSALVSRPYASKAWRAPQTERLALIPSACAICGGQVLKRRRRHCAACMPKAIRMRGERAIKKAREALARQAQWREDPRGTAEAGRKRGAANAEHHRRNREWKREHSSEKRDRAWFLREITPKLDAFTLAEIVAATGLSLAACSRFRAGTRVSHPRHWQAFHDLVRESDE